MDSLNELEIAFSQIHPYKETPPWLVDRLLRNVLADVTGNTHRTEFCIDKMYAPESATGRLGLVECRSLEMPPDARMSAAQILLMRAAIAAFWQTPYERTLIRWGTRLHDDFMLPHYGGRGFLRRARGTRPNGIRAGPRLVRTPFQFPLSENR